MLLLYATILAAHARPLTADDRPTFVPQSLWPFGAEQSAMLSVVLKLISFPWAFVWFLLLFAALESAGGGSGSLLTSTAASSSSSALLAEAERATALPPPGAAAHTAAPAPRHGGSALQEQELEPPAALATLAEMAGRVAALAGAQPALAARDVMREPLPAALGAASRRLRAASSAGMASVAQLLGTARSTGGSS